MEEINSHKRKIILDDEEIKELKKQKTGHFSNKEVTVIKKSLNEKTVSDYTRKLSLILSNTKAGPERFTTASNIFNNINDKNIKTETAINLVEYCIKKYLRTEANFYLKQAIDCYPENAQDYIIKTIQFYENKNSNLRHKNVNYLSNQTRIKKLKEQLNELKDKNATENNEFHEALNSNPIASKNHQKTERTQKIKEIDLININETNNPDTNNIDFKDQTNNHPKNEEFQLNEIDINNLPYNNINEITLCIDDENSNSDLNSNIVDINQSETEEDDSDCEIDPIKFFNNCFNEEYKQDEYYNKSIIVKSNIG